MVIASVRTEASWPYRLVMTTTHTYASTVTWSGSTGGGYDSYDRSHQVVPRGAQALLLSADPAFLGDPALVNPEQLVLAAASSCQLLSFLAVAARSGVDVGAYVDDSTAVMPQDRAPVRITEITLRPTITVRGVDPARVERMVRVAHDQCYVANTLNASVDVVAVIEVIA
jgi:organic hydroperoxide reductase OsmC/OhrA